MNYGIIRFPIKLDGALVLPKLDDRADRHEMLGALTGALHVMAGDKDPIGRAYRDKLVVRIRGILDRERGASR
jgi:hypothetical protein